MVTANDVANYFIYKSSPSTDRNITNLKLQKLLYYAQGKYMAKYNKPLFNEEIQAWKHGPVVPEIYRKYSSFIFREIDKRKTDEVSTQKIKENEAQSILDEVWEEYGYYNGKQLERMTHQQKPWKVTRGDLPDYISSTQEIEISLIKDFFKEMSDA